MTYHHKANLAGGHEGGYEKLIKLVQAFKISRIASPLMFVDQIQRCVRNELVEMSVVFFLKINEKQ